MSHTIRFRVVSEDGETMLEGTTQIVRDLSPRVVIPPEIAALPLGTYIIEVEVEVEQPVWLTLEPVSVISAPS